MRQQNSQRSKLAVLNHEEGSAQSACLFSRTDRDIFAHFFSLPGSRVASLSFSEFRGARALPSMHRGETLDNSFFFTRKQAFSSKSIVPSKGNELICFLCKI